MADQKTPAGKGTATKKRSSSAKKPTTPKKKASPKKSAAPTAKGVKPSNVKNENVTPEVSNEIAVEANLGGQDPDLSNKLSEIETNMNEVFGQCAMLMTRSPAHKNLFISDLEWLLLPAIKLRQCRLFRNKNNPVGYVSWAFFSPEVEERVMNDKSSGGVRKLAPTEWRSGEIPWIIDVVAPFGGAEKFVGEIKHGVFSDKKIKVVQPAPDGRGSVVTEW